MSGFELLRSSLISLRASATRMPTRRELPPPPANPEQSPPATVTGEELVTVPGLSGGPALEARVRAPAGAKRAVVLCHPHPLYGGTMHSAVVLAIAKVLAEKGGSKVAHVRFNYRGVGASEGRYGEGPRRDRRRAQGRHPLSSARARPARSSRSAATPSARSSACAPRSSKEARRESRSSPPRSASSTS